MKKAVFTIQMIVLIALFPVYLVTELNHVKGSQPVINESSASTESAKGQKLQPVINSDETGMLFLLPGTTVIN